MKKKITVLMALALSIVFTNTLMAQEKRKGNFRFGMSYFDRIKAITPWVDLQEYNQDYPDDSDEGVGFHCEVYLPIKNINNINLVLGGLYVYGEDGDEQGSHGSEESYSVEYKTEIIGGYVGLRSSIGKSIGIEGSACIGYFAHMGIKQVNYGDLGFSQSAGSSFGGIFNAGPFIEIGKFNCSVNIYFVGAGGETEDYASSFGTRLLIGTSFNM